MAKGAKYTAKDVGFLLRKGMAHSLRLGLHVVRDQQPAAVNSLVDVGDEPIDLANCAIFHVRLARFRTDFPGKITDDMDTAVDQLNTPARERLVHFRPVRLLRVPADNDRRALRPDVSNVRLVGPD